MATQSRQAPERVKVWSLKYVKKQYMKAESLLIDGSAEETEKSSRFFAILEENKLGMARSLYKEFNEIKKYLDTKI
jgi:hypothetical protein